VNLSSYFQELEIEEAKYLATFERGDRNALDMCGQMRYISFVGERKTTEKQR
jgi:hypothetical protein